MADPESPELEQIYENEEGANTPLNKSTSSVSRFSGMHGHGMGVGEIDKDEPGEGDGCDRCGCPDEELCCPCFWQDKGVPPIWPLSWVFDPKNKCLNDNKHARMFGNLGFKHFDKERKAYMGTALAFTIFAIIVTVFGAFSLSDDDSVVRATAWGIARSRYVDVVSQREVGQVVYLGLRKVVVFSCTDLSGDAGDDDGAVVSEWGKQGWGECREDAVWWSDVSCRGNDDEHDDSNGEGAGKGDWSSWNDGRGGSYLGWPCKPVEECRDAAVNSQFGAFTTCATLVFALIGCLTRMRKVADTNFQKVIGCIPDTIGVITQLQALLSFSAGCYDDMPLTDVAGNKIHYYRAAGLWAYAFCWVAAIVRVTMHYCTPVPGGGAGCHLVDVMDATKQAATGAKSAAVAAAQGAAKGVELSQMQARTAVKGFRKATVALRKVDAAVAKPVHTTASDAC